MHFSQNAFRRKGPRRHVTTSTGGRSGHAVENLRVVTKTIFRVMKITAFLLLVCCLHVSASGVSQTITYSGRDVTLAEIFAVIEKQTGYLVIGSKKQLDKARPVTIDAKQLPLRAFMQLALAEQPFTFTIENNTISIKRKVAANITPRLQLESTRPPVAGIVRGPDGQPLAGVNIVVKGTKRGTTTDVNGRFEVDANANDVLVISSIGYGSKELRITDDTNIIIDLQRSTSPLDEVQIIAYGTTTKRFNTGNIASVKAEDIQKQPVNNPLLALQGRVPGLQITQTSGIPGGGVIVRVQGQNSIGNGNDPLYIVDGVPYLSQMLPTTGGGAILTGSGGEVTGAGPGNPLNYINVNDIESIEVLKDADATAIYGSRAANGAVLITTKKGRAGTTKIDLNLQQGWGKAARTLDMMNTQQYLEMRREALKNDGVETPGEFDYDLNGTWDTTRYTDWQKELVGGTAHYTNINARLSGGTSNVQYSIGGTYYRETALFKGNFADQKAGLSFNLNTSSPNQKFKFQLSGNYLADFNRLPYANLNHIAYGLAPNAPALYNPDGTINWAPDMNGRSSWTNPLSYLLETYDNNTNNLIGSSTMSYEIIKGLNIKASFGYNRLQTEEATISPLIIRRPEDRPFYDRAGRFSNSTSSSWIIEPQITYFHGFGNSRLEVLAGFTFQQRDNAGQDLFATGYVSDAVIRDIRSAANIQVQGTFASTYRYNALFGRATYTLLDKYIVNLTARRDGSSRFGPESRFHNFGAIGAAWILSEEKWFKHKISFITFAKVRGSFGTTGNDQIRDYRYLDLYEPNNQGLPYQGGTGMIARNLLNPYLQWEETKKLQTGIDLGFFNDRINLNTTFVRNRSSNQLLDYTLATITGFNAVTVNFPATVQNTMWEFTLHTKNINSGQFIWATNFNVTIPKNKLVSFPNIERSNYADILIVGEPLNVNRFYGFAGVNTETGVYQFWDSEGKLTFTPDPVKDRTVILNTDRKIYGGLENSFSYKGFTLDFLFQFTRQMNTGFTFGLTRSGLPPGRRNINQPVELLDRWTKPGDITTLQKFSADFSLYQSFTDVRGSNANMVDASFIRLKNVSLSYAFTGQWKRRAGIEQLILFAQAQNVATITDFPGIDPESVGGSLVRMMTLGVRLGL